MSNNKSTFHELKGFIILWSTQALSQLGSSMTGFALTLWLYQQTGSALSTALLTICTYAPYVLMSIFAGALSDRWDKKKTMLICDSLAALSTVVVLVLYASGMLRPYHLYILNALNGMMNTVQQPASEVAVTYLTPEKHYQKVSAMSSFSRSLISILNPIFATALFSLAGLTTVIWFDLATFGIAFSALLFFIRLPAEGRTDSHKEKLSESVKAGLIFLKNNGLVFSMILFMSGVNLIASAFDAILPAFVLPKPNGGETVLGMVSACSGIAMLAGSFAAGLLPKPKNRVKVVYLTMLFSLGTENFILAFCNNPWVWCIGQFLGWFVVPIMSANEDVVLRKSIPADMQGRVYACRNSFQFFTIPVGLFLGGLLTDNVFEPLMSKMTDSSSGISRILTSLFGSGKGSGATFMMFVLGIAGVIVCLAFGKIMNRYTFHED